MPSGRRPNRHARSSASSTPWVQLSDTTENRPRTGLEAFATGTPVVADNRGGWKDMISHNHTGFLTDTHTDLLQTLTRLAQDDPFRLRIAHNARRALERELAEPGEVMAGWDAVCGRESEVRSQKYRTKTLRSNVTTGDA